MIRVYWLTYTSLTYPFSTCQRLEFNIWANGPIGGGYKELKYQFFRYTDPEERKIEKVRRQLNAVKNEAQLKETVIAFLDPGYYDPTPKQQEILNRLMKCIARDNYHQTLYELCQQWSCSIVPQKTTDDLARM
ncbi:MAG: hypothetical protein ACRCXC_03375 [Legionella sp.]